MLSSNLSGIRYPWPCQTSPRPPSPTALVHTSPVCTVSSAFRVLERCRLRVIRCLGRKPILLSMVPGHFA